MRRWDESTHRRHKEAGHSTTPFRTVGKYAALGIVAITILGVVPLLYHQYAQLAERIATLAALTFFMSAPGLWFRMGRRAVLIAVLLVGLLYATTFMLGQWHPFGIEDPLGDLFVLTVIASFLIFALAGFNLVFIGEEMVYDAHRILHLRSPAWHVMPLALSLGLAFALPILQRHGWLHLPTLWLGACASLLILTLWWGASTIRPMPQTILRELHLFAFAILLATAVADGIHYLQEASAFVPSIVAFLVLLGTWVYVSYTTLQRTHFLLRANNAAPWLAILLGASFAIIAHANALFRIEGQNAIEDLVGQRLSYMVLGIWVGLAFLAARSAVRGLTMLRGVLGAKGKRVAAGLEKVPAAVLAAERAVGKATFAALRGMDEALPGERSSPERPEPTPEPAEPRTAEAVPVSEGRAPESAPLRQSPDEAKSP